MEHAITILYKFHVQWYTYNTSLISYRTLLCIDFNLRYLDFIKYMGMNLPMAALELYNVYVTQC